MYDSCCFMVLMRCLVCMIGVFFFSRTNWMSGVYNSCVLLY